MYVFAYGSLLDPVSLRRTLPAVDPGRCVPAHTGPGFSRSFTVAFPNHGSQPDKAYVAADGSRPPVALFADLVASQTAAAVPPNGICLPVDAGALQSLRRRELRYQVQDLTGRIEPYDSGNSRLLTEVITFVGRAEFCAPADIATGLVPAAYLDSVTRGARFWDRVVPGFLDDFRATTQLPPADRIQHLTRIDG